MIENTITDRPSRIINTSNTPIMPFFTLVSR